MLLNSIILQKLSVKKLVNRLNWSCYKRYQKRNLVQCFPFQKKSCLIKYLGWVSSLENKLSSKNCLISRDSLEWETSSLSNCSELFAGKLWDDKQCAHLGDGKKENLQACKDDCKKAGDRCTAINFSPGRDCIFRACEKPVPIPTWDHPDKDFQGYVMDIGKIKLFYSGLVSQAASIPCLISKCYLSTMHHFFCQTPLWES